MVHVFVEQVRAFSLFSLSFDDVSRFDRVFVLSEFCDAGTFCTGLRSFCDDSFSSYILYQLTSPLSRCLFEIANFFLVFTFLQPHLTVGFPTISFNSLFAL